VSHVARFEQASPIRSVTLIAPMLNEAGHLEAFIADIAAQDYSGPIDLIVADGGSSDGSADLLEAAAPRANVPLTLLDNPARHVSQGLNRCIGMATGDLVVRLDCHARYPPDYVRLCVETSEATGAWNVGGVIEPHGHTPTERSVAAAMDGPFGGIGWTRSSGSSEPVETDTVTFGAFRPVVFQEAGLFDESMVRNQDAELNVRIRRAGGRIVIDPRIRLRYVPRNRLRDVFRQYFEYGRWRIVTTRKHRQVLGARSFVGAGFVVSMIALAVLSVWLREAAYLLLLELLAYLAAAVSFGARALRNRDEPLSLLPRVVAAFAAFHVGHGLGVLRGLFP
jgi:succinoglycan biosynthesis protein ExoA